MAPLWILGLLSRLRLRYLFCFSALAFIFSGATWIPLRITVYSYLSICFFFRYPVSLQPNLLLSFLASVSSTVVLFSSVYPFTSVDSRFPLSVAAPTVLQSLWPHSG